MENARLVISGAVCLFVCTAVRADYRDQIGFTLLKTELGAAAPTGAGVPVVHAETGVASIASDPTTGEFAGKHFDFIPTVPAAVDGHAQIVGTVFYGNSSIAPGIHNITNFPASFTLSGLKTQPVLLLPQNYASSPLPGDTNYDGLVDNIDVNVVTANYNKPTTAGITAGDFNLDYMVDGVDYNILSSNFGRDAKTPQLTQPIVSRGRVSNHSYLQWSDVTRRVDWMTATDDTVMVVAVNNNERIPPFPGDSGYFPTAFNTISVGRSDGFHTIVNGSSTGPYVANRQAPLLVVPQPKTSFATPVVSASAALLIETGHNQAQLSNGSYISPRTGQVIRHAETLEVIKASLLAGADRSAIASYTINSTNGLNRQFGAGQLNVYHSHHILTSGEQDSRERGNQRKIRRGGFDYNPAFSSTNIASYYFTADAARSGAVASLAWNVRIDGGAAPYWNDTAMLYHYNLGLYDLTNQTIAPVTSNSAIENTQNIFAQNLIAGHEYVFRVTAADGQNPFTWDYGLAWRFIPSDSIVLSYDNGMPQLFNGDANADGRVDSIDSTILGANWGRLDARWDQGDFDGDGQVSAMDFNLLSANYGLTNPRFGGGFIPDITTAPVPEPATSFAGAALLSLLGARRSRRNRY